MERIALHLDMDGVFTDFISQAHKAFKDFHLLEGLYPDEITCEYKSKLRTQMKKFIASYDGFWSDMPWERNGKELYEFIINNIKHENIHILTAPLSDDPTCHSGKREWIKKNFTDIDGILDRMNIDDIKWNYVDFAPAKYKILIDDRPKNINNWIANGGIGILHHSNNLESTIEQLTKYI